MRRVDLWSVRGGSLFCLSPRVELLRACQACADTRASGLNTTYFRAKHHVLDDVTGDWRATAETWADAAEQEHLLEEMNEPGRDL